MRQRPISVTVFGILNIGFALFTFAGLLLAGLGTLLKHSGNPALNALGPDTAWTHFRFAISVFFGIVLTVSGIGLLLLQNWARVLAILYSVLQILFVMADAVFSQRLMMQAITSQVHGVPPAVVELIGNLIFAIGIVIGLAYPVLLLIFMTRPKIIDAFHFPDLQELH
ncbi:MAG TPA: hypothetical protein VMR33_14505 [Candidatus Baltobacteraceae bacterium]|jgi:hypothetical protein|nr:hypothetical protein [Candidatus Baltobacteraceae bacterium]